MRGKARVRVLSYDNSVIIEDLAHSSATWSKWIQPQGSNQQSTQMGRATIGLIPSGSMDRGPEAFDYTRLAKGQRVEIYPDSGPGTATPVWTGIIDRNPQNRSTYTLEAADSLQMAANSLRFLPFSTSETADTIIKKYGLTYFAPAVADTLGSGLSSYTFTYAANGGSGITGQYGTWASQMVERTQSLVWTSDGQGGGSGGGALMRVGNPHIHVQMVPESIQILDVTWSLKQATGGGPSLAVQMLANAKVEIAAFYPTAANQAAQGFCRVFNSGGSVVGQTASFPLPAASDASGNLTVRMQVAFHLLPALASGNVPFEVLINGASIGCVDSGTGSLAHLTTADFTATNYQGVAIINYLANQGDAKGSTVAISNYTLLNSAPIFKTGTIGTPKITANPPQHDFNNASCLDIIKAACAQEGWTIYKQEGVGFGGDTISCY